MQYTAVENMRWGDLMHTRIDCDVTFVSLGKVPFTASANDPEAHGRDIFTRARNGEFGAVADYVEPTPPPAPVKTRTYKADIWRRATDAEADVIDAALNGQSTRLRRMWQDAQFLETSDDLFPIIRMAFQDAFGADRAAELLLPTE